MSDGNEVYKLIAVMLEDNSNMAKQLHALMQSHNDLTVAILQEIKLQRRETTVWWVVAMLVIMGSFWSYL